MKAIQWLSKLIVSAVITSMVCVVSTFWVVNTYVDMVLEQYQLKSAVNTTPDWSRFMTHLGKQFAGFRLFGEEAESLDPSGRMAKDKMNTTADAYPVFGDRSGTGSDSLDAKNNGGGSGTSNTQEQAPSSGSSIRKTPPEDAVAVFGHQSRTKQAQGSDTKSSGSALGAGGGKSTGSAAGSSVSKGNGSDTVAGSSIQESGSGVTGNSGSGIGISPGTGVGSDTAGKIIVSGEEFTKKKEKLSREDKNKVFNLLVTRVPQAEMQNISKMMEDGITGSELKEIEMLLQKYLKPEEYSQLLGMIKHE